MALSRKERNTIRKKIAEHLAKLDESDLPRKERNNIRRQVAELLERLDEKIDAAPEAAAGNEKLAALIAGKYDDKSPQEFLDVLKQIYDEINDIEPLKEPTISYIKKKKGSGEAITESVIDALPGLVSESAEEDDDDDDDDSDDDTDDKGDDSDDDSGDDDSDDDDDDSDDDD